jgi:MYXO-CTERM domain-containing protein
MRLTLSLAIIAIAAATPAAAQNEAVDPAANGQVNAVDSNAVAPAPAPADPAAPPMETAPLPPDADLAATDPGVTGEADTDHDPGFPWGLVGLVGLVGLLGRRRSS